MKRIKVNGLWMVCKEMDEFISDKGDDFVITDGFLWKELKANLYYIKMGMKAADKGFFKKHPKALSRCYLFKTPVEKDTEVLEGIITLQEWQDTWGEWQKVVLSEYVEQLYDTDDCEAFDTKKEALRKLAELKEDIEK